MRETGIVIKVSDGFAQVKIRRKSACGKNCAQCGGCASCEAVVNAVNTIGAAAGDEVVLEIENKRALKAAACVYMLPLAAMLAGAAAAYLAGAAEGICALSAFAAMALCFFAVRKAVLKNGKKFDVNIKSILTKQD